MSPMRWHSGIVVAIPVRNEEARIGFCLASLSCQAQYFDEILLLLNNCTDGTLAVCEAHARRFGKIRILQQALAPARASAGEARRLVLNEALAAAGDGIILTTDADAVPPGDWVAANLHAIAAGADVVCGMAELDPADALAMPQRLLEDEHNQAALLALQDEIAAMIAPSPADPWPRHQQHSGASVAIRAPKLRMAGGPPLVAAGEDRALIERLARVDARIRHAPEIAVRVSGRFDGRAAGGMAATLKRRLQQRDRLTDIRLEPTVDAYRRVLARQRVGAVLRGSYPPEALAEELLLGAGVMQRVLAAPFIGGAWDLVQRSSPVLHRRRVTFAGLAREIGQAQALRDQLRRERQLPAAESPARGAHAR